MKRAPVMVVHGGAGNMASEVAEAHQRAVANAMRAGWQVLERGGSAVEACEAAVASMENDESLNAGRGSALNQDGRVQMDALIMEGRTLRAGGVGGVERIRNPVRAARKVLEESPHVYLVGMGAEAFAARHGIPLCENQELIVERELERWREAQANQEVQVQLQEPAGFGGRQSSVPRCARPEPAGNPAADAETVPMDGMAHDTVGAVALDRDGNIAAATSTGGTRNKTPGRVGDSSLIGCGCYADNESAAVSTTGWGEPMMKLVLGKWAVDRVRAGSTPQQAAAEALAYLAGRLNGHGGMILVDGSGRVGLAHNTPHMPWALRLPEREAGGVQVIVDF